VCEVFSIFYRTRIVFFGQSAVIALFMIHCIMLRAK
jgi:hypothetical protein